MRQDGDGLRVRVFQSENRQYHYRVYEAGTKVDGLTICGLESKTLSTRAWFDVGDRRGQGHYTNGCGECRDGLVGRMPRRARGVIGEGEGSRAEGFGDKSPMCYSP